MTAQDLKNSILQLAVQGKLVPQDPNDEPASELLKRIKVGKERLIKEGLVSIDKKHTPSPIAEDDIPYEIPDTWCWVKFADIVSFYSGKTPERHTAEYWTNGECTWVSIADMIADGITVETKERITKTALSDCFSGKMSPAGTMIMSFKLTIGKISLLGIDAVHNEAIISIFPFLNDATLKDYLFKVLPLLANSGDSKNAIKGKTLNATSLSNLMIPLPPLAEQERIVAKIEELMPLVEEYGKAEERLTTLNAEFPDKLRKSILQQAIQGKLTERDPDEEPASELLNRIRAEKERLIKEGKIKKEKPLPPIKEEEIPFEIPDTWTWVKIGEITQIQSSKRVFEKDYVKNGVPFFRSKEIGDLQRGESINTPLYISREHYDSLKQTVGVPSVGDVLVTSVGTIGNVWICDGREFYYKDGNITQICKNGSFIPEYVELFIHSPLFEQQAISTVAGTAYSALTIIKLKNLLLPLPPLVEQQRIVDRVNELLAVCDELK